MTEPAAERAISSDRFFERLALIAAEIEADLSAVLSSRALPHEIYRPDRLLAAMRHATLNGGKRIRPFFVAEMAAMLAPDLARTNRSGLVRIGTALELVHCYSLVHDDLPAMDDDDLRRGQPTVHRKFDEATAILAGDGLLTLAFDLLATEDTKLDDRARLDLIVGLTRAAGLGGMVGGQMLDLAAEGRHAVDRMPLRLNEQDIRQLQAMKTGALLRFACEAGAIFAGGSPETRALTAQFGRLVGQAFQIADDLIDVESAPALAGKATGKDAARGKATLVSLHGPQSARLELDGLIEAADATLAQMGGDGGPLRAAARFVANRTF